MAYDTLYRRAKARAAMEGISLSRFLEISLKNPLNQDEKQPGYWAGWARNMPRPSKEAVAEVRCYARSGQ
jgi:hypothetical protein